MSAPRRDQTRPLMVLLRMSTPPPQLLMPRVGDRYREAQANGPISAAWVGICNGLPTRPTPVGKPPKFVVGLSTRHACWGIRIVSYSRIEKARQPPRVWELGWPWPRPPADHHRCWGGLVSATERPRNSLVSVRTRSMIPSRKYRLSVPRHMCIAAGVRARNLVVLDARRFRAQSIAALRTATVMATEQAQKSINQPTEQLAVEINEVPTVEVRSSSDPRRVGIRTAARASRGRGVGYGLLVRWMPRPRTWMSTVSAPG